MKRLESLKKDWLICGICFLVKVDLNTFQYYAMHLCLSSKFPRSVPGYSATWRRPRPVGESGAVENRQPQRKNYDRRTTRAHGGRAPGAGARAGTVSEPGNFRPSDVQRG